MAHSGRYVACSLTLVALLAGPALAAPKQVDFNRDIRPILSNTCYTCHGPDDKTREAKLRLDSFDGATAAAESGAQAIVPGKSGESELIKRLTSDDPSVRMPPASSGKTITPEQVELLKAWIDQGGQYRGHWAFTAPVRPIPPAAADASLVRNPIDQFVQARLTEGGLKPSPEADKATLLRRLSFDLTGLPPTPAELDAFLADQSANAYATQVDRLLGSLRFGEHQARYWLDAARYGDTHGLHFDNERALWMYRDWVVTAINGNMPFDQFTIEQMAGDLLPEATMAQKVATGFNRCNVSTSEGGSIDEEVLVRYASDRVETMSTVFLGLTAQCAACHDHKFDPITQRDFYRLSAYFNRVNERAMDGNQLLPAPVLRVPTNEQKQQQATIQTQISEAEQKIRTLVAEAKYEEPVTDPAAAEQPQEIVWVDDDLPAGAQPAGDGGAFTFVTAAQGPVFSGQKSHKRQAASLSQHYFTNAKDPLVVGAGDKLFAYVYLDPLDLPKAVMLQWNDGGWEHRAYWGEDVIAFGQANTPGHVAAGPLPEAEKWVRLEIEAAKVGLNPGAKINGWAFTQFGGTVHWDKAGIVTRTPQGGAAFDSLLVWEGANKENKALPGHIQANLKIEREKRTAEQQKQVLDYFIENAWSKTRETITPLQTQLADYRKQLTAIDAAIPGTMIMEDAPMPRDTFILMRGQYDKKGEKVEPGTPAAFPPLPADAPPTRLALARWLVDPAQPLTARVIINRYWQQFFGIGIVETAEDFGAQGAYPSHPELLDWLAVEFRESGWNVKHMLKLMVMSHAYRQSAQVKPEHLEHDRQNRLLARGPRFRLDAEMVRDNALFVAGLLSPTVGGRGVRPYQPEGIWEAVSFLGSNTGVFKADQGQALYRRSLYTFWKRTAPPPSMMAFDAPSREACSVRRSRTNTPMQALVLLNDTQYVEAARSLAQRMLTEGGTTPEERLTYGFRLAVSRPPRADELAVFQKQLGLMQAAFTADLEAAKKLVEVGETKRNDKLDAVELATWTMLGNLLLNLDEAITKG